MGERKFLAGLGTLIIFAGIYSFKALSDKVVNEENRDGLTYTPRSIYKKAFLILLGCICVILGSLLILRALKLV